MTTTNLALAYSFIFFMTVMGSVASLFLKKASGSIKGNGIVQIFINMLKTPSLYVGGILYVLASVLNIFVLKIMDYSSVLPLTAFTYVWTMFLARWRFGEKMTVKKMVGVALIVVGAVLISRA